MIGPNLSEWALKKRSLVVFLMIIGVVAGVMSFMKLGRGEDPAITVAHDGRRGRLARCDGGRDDQAGDRAARAYPAGDRLPRSPAQLHHRRADDDLRRPEAIDAASTRFPTSGTRCARTSATCATRCRRACSGRSSTTTSATPSASSTRSPPTASTSANCATTWRPRARGCCRCPTSRRSRCWARRTSRSSSSSRLERLAGLRLNLNQIVATLQAQNLVRPAGTMQGEQERVFLRVTGAFDSERDIEAVNIVSGDRIFRLGDIATVRRGFTDPPQPMFRVNGKQAIGLAIAMRDAGDILALGENVRKEMAEHQGQPAGRHRDDAGGRPGGDGRSGDQRLHDLACGRPSSSSWCAASSAWAYGPARWWRWPFR